ncbi:hypothetical protein P175DRAFT_0426433 [Aspergillus ochraceoroseus IBT 24754]|uniref:Uncharacterized protein n=2 Tax=Aspergillus subgen. Nidulantes TaxID=2720870 RepID=A0A0F8XMH7_9EURO|nr:uncharacterized protein P175DRAFT_0426433 [Aspergillus ochraceoroseus IBT 24754]KKK24717.1 hypothetical protein ARAM_004713 [Aspergillus rambellii]PTU24508.1 hypothetical protein P175DRAFT_0426433 [Aspergillus ochraceoroseus IBT 24754]
MPQKRRKLASTTVQNTTNEPSAGYRAASTSDDGPSEPETSRFSAKGGDFPPEEVIPEESEELFRDPDEETPEESMHTIADTHEDKRTTSRGLEGGYNALKSYKGQYYSGMAVGGSHIWNYDQGVWKETKEEPNLWKIDYRTKKRREKKAPQGSGAPVGTEYHWLIVGHQFVKKVDANTYETSLTGSKYKLAYKATTSNSWSVPTVKKQREREIELLEDAKLRVRGLPPVLASEKVKVEKHERGQTKLDSIFSRVESAVHKRKAEQ